jgi:hypothetical protein
MTRKTMLALIAQADATLEDNTTGAITAADVRNLIKDVIDSFAPGYGAAANPLVTLPALGITPQIVKYTQNLAQTPEYAMSLAAGTITRLAQGLPTTVNRVSFYADVAAPAGNEVVFSLFRNGVDIPGGTTVSGQGAGNVSQAAFSVGTTSPDGADYTYDIRATKISGGADNVELSNVRFILESVPTLGI